MRITKAVFKVHDEKHLVEVNGTHEIGDRGFIFGAHYRVGDEAEFMHMVDTGSPEDWFPHCEPGFQDLIRNLLVEEVGRCCGRLALKLVWLESTMSRVMSRPQDWAKVMLKAYAPEELTRFGFFNLPEEFQKPRGTGVEMRFTHGFYQGRGLKRESYGDKLLGGFK